MPEDPRLSCAVSVIIPIYNNYGPYLANAIESVLAQTYRDFCIILVDDGSTDSTVDVALAYADRCVYVRQANGGTPSARNCGIRLSESPYVAFLDADDEWAPAKLERQMEVLTERPKAGMACSDFSISGPQPIDSYFRHCRGPMDGRVFRAFLRQCWVLASTVVVRRECLHEVGLFDESLAVCDDLNLFLRIASRWQVASVREVLVKKCNHAANVTSSTSVGLALGSMCAALEQVKSACPDLPAGEWLALERTLAWKYYDYASHLLNQGDRQAARARFREALQHNPAHWRALAKLGASFFPPPVYEHLIRLARRIRPKVLVGG
jgi:glycosyltransferase involved in cell wall biosynthesis